MTYAVVRPSGLPYEAPEHAPLFSPAPHIQLDAGIIGSGSLADDSDGTAVQLYASLDDTTEPDIRRSSIVAVDFAALPTLTDEMYHGDIVRVLQTAPEVSGAHVCEWLLIHPVTGEPLSTLPGRFDYHLGELDVLATHTSGLDWYQLEPGAQAVMRTEGWAVAFAVVPTISTPLSGDVLHYTLYEFGLQLDVNPRRRPSALRHRQRGDGYGASSAPRGRQNNTQQASLRGRGIR